MLIYYWLFLWFSKLKISHAKRLVAVNDGVLDASLINSPIISPPQVVNFMRGSIAKISCPRKSDSIEILHATFPGALSEALEDLTQYTVAQQCSGLYSCDLAVNEVTFPFIPNKSRPTNLMLGRQVTLPVTTLCSIIANAIALDVTPLTNGGWSATTIGDIKRQNKDSASFGISTPLPSTATLLALHKKKLGRDFLRLPQIYDASCKKMIKRLKTFSIEEAQELCIKTPSCSIITTHPSEPIVMCEGNGLIAPSLIDGAYTLIKGSQAISNEVTDKYVIYLNQQAICEDDHVLKEQGNIRSIDDAAKQCDNTPNCEYFIVTTVTGIYDGLPPMTLWLCRQEGATTAIQRDGSISGYTYKKFQLAGEPQILA